MMCKYNKLQILYKNFIQNYSNTFLNYLNISYIHIIMYEEISDLYDFNYTCVYHIYNIKNNSQYEYDLSQIISKPEDKTKYNIKLLKIFAILNENKYTKFIFNLLRQKMSEEFSNETNTLHNIILFYKILSYEFLYVYHPCICDLYHDNEIKSENLNRLLEKLDSYTI